MLEKLRLLANCANSASYDFTDEEVAQIFEAIEDEVRATRAKFRRNSPRKFRLR